MNETDSLTAAERVLGPVRGCFLASYAVAEAGACVAYTKVFDRPIVDAWELPALGKFTAEAATAEEAMLLAEGNAERSIRLFGGALLPLA